MARASERVTVKASGTRVTKRVTTWRTGGKEGTTKREGEGYCLYLELFPFGHDGNNPLPETRQTATAAGAIHAGCNSEVFQT
jgi:hypothetical protein